MVARSNAAFLLLPALLVASTSCRWVAGYGPSQPVVTADSGTRDVHDGPPVHDGPSDVVRPDGGGCAPWSSGACPLPQQLALGVSFSCLLVAGGAVYCWGDNGGQVFGLASSDSAWPQRVNGVKLASATTGASDRKIAAGAGHVCGIGSDGQLVCWGFNEDGQVDPSKSALWLPPTSRTLPAGVRAKSVALGDYHSCALSEDGAVYCWGTNYLGQLGTPDPSSTMRRVTLPPMTALACGTDHCCAANGAGTLRCWGAANHSQLNVDPAGMDFSDQPLPSSLSGSVKRLACGGENCCAVVDTSLFCWGDNSIDQLGLNSQVDHQGATPVPGLVDVAGVAVGGAHVCAHDAAGATSCWGYNRYGQVGIPLATNSRTPQPISVAFDELALGEHHSCGIRAATVSCWGRNRAGQLGNGQQARRHTTLPVVRVGQQKVQSLAAGGYHTCALDSAGGLQCWGFNIYGQAGQSSATELSLPEPYNPAQGVTGLGLGALHSCYLSGTELRCFGASWAGQLAFDPNTALQSQPHLVALETVAVAAGHDHTCALDKSTAVFCWGTNNKGQLGFPADGLVHAAPKQLAALGAGNKAIAARYNVSCVIDKDDQLRCWGDQTHRQIGTQQTGDFWHPQGYSSKKVSAVALAGRHGCALLPSKQIECWGDDHQGRLGVESLAAPDQVVTVPGPQKYEAIAAGWHFTCALDDNKDVYCWGANGTYGLGTDQLRSTFMPQKVALPAKVVTLAVGWEHVCALLEDDTVRCWGSTSFGQLGEGTVTQTAGPTRILP